MWLAFLVTFAARHPRSDRQAFAAVSRRETEGPCMAKADERVSEPEMDLSARSGPRHGGLLRDLLNSLRTTRRPKTPTPWEAAYPPEVDWRAAIPQKPLFEILDDAVRRFPDHACLDFLDKSYSYRDLGALVDRAAKGFRELGVEKGTRIALFLPNTPYYVICFFGALKAGAIVVNLNPLYAEGELEFLVRDSGAEILVAMNLEALYPKIASLLDRTLLRRIVVCRMSGILPFPKSTLFRLFRRRERATIPDDGRHVWFDSLTDNDGIDQPAAIDPRSDPAVLQYTGGTTGRIKAAILTHGGLYANAMQLRNWFHRSREGDERFLCVLPLSHVFAMVGVLCGGLFLGSEIVLLPRFTAENVIETIRRKKITFFLAVPAMYAEIARHRSAEQAAFASLIHCVSGGAPLPPETKRRFEDKTGATILEGYGLSESSAAVTCAPVSGKVRVGSVGMPLPGTTVEIVAPDPPHRPLAVGETGEVWVSGPQIMTGYWKRPEETAEVLVGPYLRTGDLGRFDAEGYLYLTGRCKNLILVGGFNVYPRAVEKAIASHPEVAEARVSGVPDRLRGEAVTALVRRTANSQLSSRELRTFLENRLARYEIPRRVTFVEAMPQAPAKPSAGLGQRIRNRWAEWRRRRRGIAGGGS
jgi:long-chain acyl-CoA synthetase